MAQHHETGSRVKWRWGNGIAEGKVVERFERRVQRTIKGSKVVRKGTADNPAYLIVQEDGRKVLKREAELAG